MTTEFLQGLLPSTAKNLIDVQKYAEENHVPIITPEVANFLTTLIKLTKPTRILEIGTAIGYSAMVMRNSCGASITTIEKNPEIAEIAKQNTKNSNIEIIVGDAAEVLADMQGEFDFIFLDAAKGQYLRMLDDCMRLLQVGGMLVCDNVLYQGMVASGEVVARKKRTIVNNLREFLHEISNHAKLQTTVLPLGDGVSVSIVTN